MIIKINTQNMQKNINYKNFQNLLIQKIYHFLLINFTPTDLQNLISQNLFKMHDTSTESTSGKWKTIGAQKRVSTILNPMTSTQKVESKRYKPSKDRQSSNSKIFNIANIARSKIQSFDGQDAKEGNVKQNKRRQSSRQKSLHKSISMDAPLIRINAAINGNQTYNHQRDGPITNRSNVKSFNFTQQKQLLNLKEDYTKFKNKIINQLQLQKQNVTKIINQILQSVKQQLSAIQEKYAKTYNLKAADMNAPSFKNFTVPMTSTPVISQIKLSDISTIKKVTTPRQFSKNPSQKALIAELTSLKSVQSDPVTQRFSKFYSAIQKLKSDLDCLHQISVINNQSTDSPMITPLTSPTSATGSGNFGFKSGLSSFLKT